MLIRSVLAIFCKNIPFRRIYLSSKHFSYVQLNLSCQSASFKHLDDSFLSDIFWPKKWDNWSKLKKIVIEILMTHLFFSLHIFIYDLINIPIVSIFWVFLVEHQSWPPLRVLEKLCQSCSTNHKKIARKNIYSFSKKCKKTVKILFFQGA